MVTTPALSAAGNINCRYKSSSARTVRHSRQLCERRRALYVKTDDTARPSVRPSILSFFLQQLYQKTAHKVNKPWKYWGLDGKCFGSAKQFKGAIGETLFLLGAPLNTTKLVFKNIIPDMFQLPNLMPFLVKIFRR